MQMGLAFAGLLVVGAMAMVMYELFSVVERHTTGWAHQARTAAEMLPFSKKPLALMAKAPTAIKKEHTNHELECPARPGLHGGRGPHRAALCPHRPAARAAKPVPRRPRRVPQRAGAPPGGLVGGDTLEVHAQVAGAHALITTPGATRFYRSEGATALQRTQLAVAEGARLEWLPLESLCYSACQAETTSPCNWHPAPKAWPGT